MPTILLFIYVHYIWGPFLTLAQLLVILYPGVLIFWLIMHTNIERWRRIGKKAYWIAAIGWPLTGAPLIYFREETFPMPYRFPGPFSALGLVPLLLTFVVAKWARNRISLRTLVGLPELAPHKNKQPLIDSCIYAKTRNPVYLSHWLLLLSAAAITGFVANWILFALDCVVLPLMIRAEEHELLKRYGTEFAAYMRRVPRFFPGW